NAPTRATHCACPLPPGVYGLSNEFLDTPWPKLERVRTQFRRWLAADAGGTDGLMALLHDHMRVADDSLLPDTGVTREWERILSAPFVQHPDYGTRSSTVLLLQAGGDAQVAARRIAHVGAPAGESQFTLPAGEWP